MLALSAGCTRASPTALEQSHASLKLASGTEIGVATLSGTSIATTRAHVELTDAAPTGEWNATLRDGDCSEPGDLVHPIGVVEGTALDAIVDAPLRDLEGLIVALAPLGEEQAIACGVVEGSVR